MRRLVALGGVVIAGLACGGLHGPARIVAVRPAAGPCGAWTAEVQTADLRGQTVVVTVDGAPMQRWEAQWGAPTLVVEGQGAPGAALRVDVAVEGTPSRSEATLALTGGALAATVTPATAVEGQPLELVLEVRDEACALGVVPWRATTPVATASGTATAPRSTISLPPHPAGPVIVAVEVGAGASRVRATASVLVTSAGAPTADDADGDGFAAGADCDDGDPRANPMAPERPDPNGRDDDCDGLVDEGTTAYDDDGDGRSEQEGDCDDRDPRTHPGAREIADCRDDDCDGEVDDGAAFRPWPDDAYEGTRARLGGGARRTDVTVALVARDLGDEERFELWSQDGDWDAWGIDVVAERLPHDSIFAVQVIRFDGTVVATGSLGRDGDQVNVIGRPFRDDSGVYEVVVRPTRLWAEGCPASLRVTAR